MRGGKENEGVWGGEGLGGARDVFLGDGSVATAVRKGGCVCEGRGEGVSCEGGECEGVWGGEGGAKRGEMSSWAMAAWSQLQGRGGRKGGVSIWLHGDGCNMGEEGEGEGGHREGGGVCGFFGG